MYRFLLKPVNAGLFSKDVPNVPSPAAPVVSLSSEFTLTEIKATLKAAG